LINGVALYFDTTVKSSKVIPSNFCVNAIKDDDDRDDDDSGTHLMKKEACQGHAVGMWILAHQVQSEAKSINKMKPERERRKSWKVSQINNSEIICN
jgi:hypothetical protein